MKLESNSLMEVMTEGEVSKTEVEGALLATEMTEEVFGAEEALMGLEKTLEIDPEAALTVVKRDILSGTAQNVGINLFSKKTKRGRL